jgi:hypothetical protein
MPPVADMTYNLGAATLYQPYYANDAASWFYSGFSMTGTPEYCGTLTTTLTTSYSWLTLDTVNKRIGVNSVNPADVGTWAVTIKATISPA